MVLSVLLTMERWRGKVAVVTGASAGIGAAIAEKLVKSGLQVVGLARRLEKLQELESQFTAYSGKFYCVKCDVSNEDEIEAAFKWIKQHVGVVQILVNNAGVLREGFLYNGSTEDWRLTFSTNFLGLISCTHLAVSTMQGSGLVGHIVHINSIAGHGVPQHRPPCAGAYPAAKNAVTALSALSLGPNIKLTSISPGLTRTGMYTEEDQEKGLPCLEPEDVAGAVVFALGTPPHVEIKEIIIKPTGEAV